ncbi:hypothetical protein E2562_037226 [Oryza meyeriana var. granulata]|uniref:Uncharacterized protein n=1 Tax=Oryza meyeriana var. granulata TaxID=110450 RepID=A0A6G1ETW6_9ORYZ|nr:hypothetical protein E2562_037226 [Oryza meyeriana var. granulata]
MAERWDKATSSTVMADEATAGERDDTRCDVPRSSSPWSRKGWCGLARHLAFEVYIEAGGGWDDGWEM